MGDQTWGTKASTLTSTTISQTNIQNICTNTNHHRAQQLNQANDQRTNIATTKSQQHLQWKAVNNNMQLTKRHQQKLRVAESASASFQNFSQQPVLMTLLLATLATSFSCYCCYRTYRNTNKYSLLNTYIYVYIHSYNFDMTLSCL